MTYLRKGMKRFFVLLAACWAFLLAPDSEAFGQASGRKNLANFDTRPYHFGFMLSGNRSHFHFAMSDSASADFRGVYNKPLPSFNMHLMGSYTLSKHWRVRFEPGLSFQDRQLNFLFNEPTAVVDPFTYDTTYTYSMKETEKMTEAVYLDIPVMFKWRTERVNNVAAYTLVGFKYTRDFQSQEDVNQQLQSGNALRLKSGNVCADVGAGLDFFLPYFKFAVQLKTEHGLRNVLIRDGGTFSSPLEFLKTRSVVLSFCFEG